MSKLLYLLPLVSSVLADGGDSTLKYTLPTLITKQTFHEETLVKAVEDSSSTPSVNATLFEGSATEIGVPPAEPTGRVSALESGDNATATAIFPNVTNANNASSTVGGSNVIANGTASGIGNGTANATGISNGTANGTANATGTGNGSWSGIGGGVATQTSVESLITATDTLSSGSGSGSRSTGSKSPSATGASSTKTKGKNNGVPRAMLNTGVVAIGAIAALL